MINYTFKTENEKTNYLNGMVLDMSEALKEIYTSEIIEFIKDAKRGDARAWLNEESTFQGNEWLLDSVIKSMGSDIDLSLIAEAENIPRNATLTTKQTCLFQIQEMKLDLITLLSLRYALQEAIKENTKQMIQWTNTAQEKAKQCAKETEAANDGSY